MVLAVLSSDSEIHQGTKNQMAGAYPSMDQARPTRKLLHWKPMGTTTVGRPRQRWQEDVHSFISIQP